MTRNTAGRTLPPGLTDAALAAALTRPVSVELEYVTAAQVAASIRATPQRRAGLRWPWACDPGLTRPWHGRLATAVLAIALVIAVLVATAVAAVLLRGPALPANGLLIVGSEVVGLTAVDPVAGTSRSLVPPWSMSASGRTGRSDLIALSPGGDRLAYLQTLPDHWFVHVVEVATGSALARYEWAGDQVYPEWDIAWNGDATRLVLAATIGGMAGVVTLDAETGALGFVHPADAAGHDPAIGPDGHRIAYIGTSSRYSTDYRLIVTDDLGLDALVVLETLPDGARVDGSPAWSPDGRTLVVTVRDPDGRYALVAVGADGQDPVRLTEPSHEWVEGRFSPEGERILVAISPQGGRQIDAFATGSQMGRLDVIAADGTDRRPVVAWSLPGATWSPDGTAIAYVLSGDSTRQVRVVDADGTDDRSVWTGDADWISLGWQARPDD